MNSVPNGPKNEILVRFNLQELTDYRIVPLTSIGGRTLMVEGADVIRLLLSVPPLRDFLFARIIANPAHLNDFLRKSPTATVVDFARQTDHFRSLLQSVIEGLLSPSPAKEHAAQTNFVATLFVDHEDPDLDPNQPVMQVDGEYPQIALTPPPVVLRSS